MIGRRRAWHDISSLGQHTRSNDVGLGMTSPPLDNTNGRTTSSVACYHRVWPAHTLERRRAWHAIITFGHHKRLNNVRRGMKSPPLDSTHGRQRWAWHDITALGQHTRSNDVGCGMTSPPLDNTHGRRTSDMACHHRLWEAHTVERHRAWHAIIAFGQHTRSNNVGRGMQLSPLGSTDSQTAWHGMPSSPLDQHRRSTVIGRDMPS